MLDITFIVPNNSNVTYQQLSNKYSAIETPTWALLLAESCRKKVSSKYFRYTYRAIK